MSTKYAIRKNPGIDKNGHPIRCPEPWWDGHTFGPDPDRAQLFEDRAVAEALLLEAQRGSYVPVAVVEFRP